jgi:hypothetical protein
MNDNIDLVEFYFNDPTTSKEVVRKYEVSMFDDAVRKFQAEFPEANSRPRIYRIRSEHLKSKVV